MPTDDPRIDDLLQRYARWLPAAPHIGMIRHVLREDWAHIEEDEAGEPFVVNNHGGRIPLAAVRWDPNIGGSEMRSDDPARGHRYGTVCDTVDAVLGGRETDNRTQRLDDITDMLRRMHAREAQMLAALEDVERCLQPRPTVPEQEEADLRELVAALQDPDASDAASVGEALKGKAALLEKRLDAYRSIALEIGRIFERMRGNRRWHPQATRTDTDNG